MAEARDEFTLFVESIEERLRRALVARYGPEIGRDVTADALGWAWRNWERLSRMEHPVAYLYRVGQSNARRYRTRTGPLESEPAVDHEPAFEPRLQSCLLQLSKKQRVAVVLVYGMQWSQQEVADLLQVKPTTVQNHLSRGLDKLTRLLGDRECRIR